MPIPFSSASHPTGCVDPDNSRPRSAFKGSDSHRGPKKHDSEGNDERRNIYVLGIPHNMSLEELKELFGRFGSVQHAVILAVLDAFRRRRGFVVMSSNPEAARAMKGMSGTVVQGHKFHCSWAVVQRSNGFLDGADRSTLPNSPLEISSNDRSSSMSLTPSPVFRNDRQLKLPLDLSIQTSLHRNPILAAQSKSLIIQNLHAEIFKTASDVLPLIEPFGTIHRIQIIQNDHLAVKLANSNALNDCTPKHKTRSLLPTDDECSAEETSSSNPQKSPKIESDKLAYAIALAEFSEPREAALAKSALDGAMYGAALRVLLVPNAVGDSGDEVSVKDKYRIPSESAFDQDYIPNSYRPISQSQFRKWSTHYSLSSDSSYYSESPSIPYLGSPSSFGFGSGGTGFHNVTSPGSMGDSHRMSAPPSPTRSSQYYPYFPASSPTHELDWRSSPAFAANPQYCVPTDYQRHYEARSLQHDPRPFSQSPQYY